MRIPDAIPLGLTFLLAIALAIVFASLVKSPSDGNVDTVLTFWTHRFLDDVAITCYSLCIGMKTWWRMVQKECQNVCWLSDRYQRSYPGLPARGRGPAELFGSILWL